MIASGAVATVGRSHSTRGARSEIREIRYRYCGADGQLVYEVIRRPPKKFTQRRPGPGEDKWIYNLTGVERIPYRLPELVEFAADTRNPGTTRAIFVAEGEKDVECLRGLGLMATTNAQGAKWAWPDGWATHFEGYEQAFVFPDNDEAGRRHAQQVAGVLAQAVPDVRVVELPGLESSGGDVSDFIAAGNDVDRLWSVCDSAPSWRAPDRSVIPDEHPSPVRYRATPAGIVRSSAMREGVSETQLTNFRAEIVADEEIDDGVETRRSFEIEARMNGGPPRTFAISAERFGDVTRWASEQLGARAIVYPGQSIASHAKVAIQELSQSIRERRIFAHTGWRRIDDGWAYFHGGGAIGADGVIPDVLVRLSDQLAGYLLPEPPSGDVLAEAVRSSLALVDLAPPLAAVAVLGATYRAVLGPADVSVALIGSTGHGKSELAARAQQHFGADFHAKSLPANWSSTANALEELTFAAKDSLQVIDDFAPEGSRTDIDRMHRDAARILRAQGNRSGRQRMRRDATVRAERPPRGLVMLTGEEMPRGESVRARTLIVELTVGALRWDLLDAAQEAGRTGVYASAMAGFVRWLAPRFGSELAGEFLGAETAKIRGELATSGGLHRRTPDAVASLALGWRYFLAFARDVGAITADEHDARWGDVVAGLADLGSAQRAHQSEADPVRRFLEALRSAIVTGDAHLAGADGGCPDGPPARWGWRSEPRAGYAGPDARPSGRQVGWVCDGHAYLDPAAAVSVAAQLAQRGGEPFPSTQTGIGKRLNDAGMLDEREEGRGVLTVRKSLSGGRRTVWSLQAEAFLPARENLPNPPISPDDASW